jgi:hypothetical protein
MFGACLYNVLLNQIIVVRKSLSEFPEDIHYGYIGIDLDADESFYGLYPFLSTGFDSLHLWKLTSRILLYIRL